MVLIEIMGNIGVGKTTYTKFLREELKKEKYQKKPLTHLLYKTLYSILLTGLMSMSSIRSVRDGDPATSLSSIFLTILTSLILILEVRVLIRKAKINNKKGTIKIIKETFDEFLLKKFKEDKKYAIELQESFLYARLKDNKKVLKDKYNFYVCDYSLDQDLIFLDLLLENKDIDKIQYDKYFELKKKESIEYRKPDLIILLRADLETILNRIKKRSRVFEIGEEEYHTKLFNKYEIFFEKVKNNKKYKIIDFNKNYDQLIVEEEKLIEIDIDFSYLENF